MTELRGPGGREIADLTPGEARAFVAAFCRRWDLDAPAPIAAVETLGIPALDASHTIGARLYRPAPSVPDPLPLLVFCHAGGYVFGSLDTHDSFCRIVSADAGALVLSVDYRLAPEARFPAAHEDCYAATLWAGEQAASLGADPKRLAIGGDSSGGTLAIGVCQLVARHGGPSLAKLMLWYPGTAGGPPSESMRRYGRGHFLTERLMRWSMRHYLEDPSQGADPLLAPLSLAYYGLFPPTYLVTAGHDPRRDDNRTFVDRLRGAGVDAEYHCVDETIHGFGFMLGGIDAGLRATRASAAHLRAALADPPGSHRGNHPRNDADPAGAAAMPAGGQRGRHRSGGSVMGARLIPRSSPRRP